MPLMQWKSSYNTGIAIVDSQHAHLVALLNELFDAMSQGKANTILGDLLDRLIDYTRTHFSEEERLMSANAYSQLEAHRKEHREMVQAVSGLAADFRAGKIALSGKVFQYLRDWLQNHILIVDQKMAAEIRKAPSRRSFAGVH